MTTPISPNFAAGSIVSADDLQALSDLVSLGWVDYTPTLTNITLGTGGSRFGRYRWLNANTIAVRIQITLGSDGSFSGTAEVGLPDGVTLDTSVTQIGDCVATDSSPFTRDAGTVYMSDSTFSRFIFDRTNQTGANASYPWTWASGDVLIAGGIFETV